MGNLLGFNFDLEQRVLSSLDKSLSRIPRLTPQVAKTVDSIPSELSPYFGPEMDYILSKTRAVDTDLEELKREKQKLRNNPYSALDLTIRQLISFEDPAKQTRFVQNLTEAIEDIAYALELAVSKAYQIAHVKENTPVIGFFARQQTKNLPSQETMLDFIKKQRESALGLVNKIYSVKTSSSSREDLKTGYAKRMAPIYHSRGLEIPLDYEREFALGNVVFTNPNHLEGKEERFERNMFYSRSRYNDFFEKTIGVLATLVSYAVSYFSERFSFYSENLILQHKNVFKTFL